MPRDDWAKASRADAGRRVQREKQQAQAAARENSRVLRKGYSIPKGTLVSVCRDDGQKDWQEYTTTKPLRFSRYESLSSGAYVFRQNGWLLLIRQHKVRAL